MYNGEDYDVNEVAKKEPNVFKIVPKSQTETFQQKLHNTGLSNSQSNNDRLIEQEWKLPFFDLQGQAHSLQYLIKALTQTTYTNDIKRP